MFQSLDFFVLSCVFLTAESQTGQILPPQHVALRWISAFQPELSWAPPPHPVENCTYTVSQLGKDKHTVLGQENKVETLSWSEHLRGPSSDDDDGQIYWLSVETVCNDIHSKRSYVRIGDSGLVTDVQCVIISPKHTHCSWSPTSDVPDLGFFYNLRNEDGTTSINNDTIPPLRACSSYNYTGGIRTGCNLQAKITQAIHILLNGTLSNNTVNRTFRLRFGVRPPALDWTVDRNGNKFDISWIPPDIGDLSNWSFRINYTECDETKEINIQGKTSYELEPAPHCRCCISIKAEGKKYGLTEDGWTPWSDVKCFDAATDPNSLVFVAIVVPLLFAVLAVLTFACWRKNKDSIFPKVPEPRDFLSDISDNNNKGNVRNLYIPAEEEEACKITLVIDPQNNKHDF